MDNKFHTQRILNNVQRLVHGELPGLLANQAQNFFVDSFKKQGWDDNGLKKWPSRQNKTKRKGRSILVKSGALRRAADQSIRQASFSRVQLIVALPYAAVHNDGFSGTRRAHMRKRFIKGTTNAFIGLRRDNSNQYPKGPRRTTVFTPAGQVSVKAHRMRMPQRKFMGDSATLRKKQRALIIKQIDRVWQA